MSDEYVVVATQINRYNATSKESTQLHRGDTFTAADVDADELARWLKIKPAPVMSKADYEKRQEQTPLGAAQRIAQLEAELAALRGDDESGGDHAADADGDGKLDVPADNASAAAWREYAGATEGLSDEDRAWIADKNTSRDMLRDKYKPAA